VAEQYVQRGRELVEGLLAQLDVPHGAPVDDQPAAAHAVERGE
jgi:hypothetical protein